MFRQLWLINYRSGNWQGARLANAIATRVSVRELDFSRLGEQLQESAAFERVIVAGGDGTFATILNEATEPSSPLHHKAIGLFPIGTANDLAREVGTYELCTGVSSDDLVSAFDTLSERQLAIWELAVDGKRYGFCNYASLGFEGAVVGDFHRWRMKSKLQHRLLNRVMYALFGVRHALFTIPETHIDERGASIACARAHGIILSNLQSHMGIGVLSRESDPFDDVIECVRVSSPFDYARMFATKAGLWPSLRALHRGTEFSIRGLPPRTPLQIDGETKSPVDGGTVEVRLKGYARVLWRGNRRSAASR